MDMIKQVMFSTRDEHFMSSVTGSSPAEIKYLRFQRQLTSLYSKTKILRIFKTLITITVQNFEP